MDLFFNSHDKISRKFRNARFVVQSSSGYSSKADDGPNCRLMYTTRHKLSKEMAEAVRVGSILVVFKSFLCSHTWAAASRRSPRRCPGPLPSCSVEERGGGAGGQWLPREPTPAESGRDGGVLPGAPDPESLG